MKIAFFDIDGTLINVPAGMMKPSMETITCLKAFQEAGNKVIIASACACMPEALQVLHPDGFIGVDGHYIVYQGEVLLNDLFTPEEISLQEKVCHKYHGAFEMNGPHDQYFSDIENPMIWKHEELYSGGMHLPMDYDINRKPESYEVNVITALFETAQDLHAAMKELPAEWAINAYDTGHIRMDIHKPGHSKGSACVFVADRLGVASEETYAFGDGLNDIEMLSLCGHGVAMGNASEEVKAHADVVTKSVNEEGVAFYLWQIMKN